MLDVLQSKLGLHQKITIVYLVTGYQAVLRTTDGYKTVDGSSIMPSVMEALLDLQEKTKDFDITHR